MINVIPQEQTLITGLEALQFSVSEAERIVSELRSAVYPLIESVRDKLSVTLDEAAVRVFEKLDWGKIGDLGKLAEKERPLFAGRKLSLAIRDAAMELLFQPANDSEAQAQALVWQARPSRSTRRQKPPSTDA